MSSVNCLIFVSLSSNSLSILIIIFARDSTCNLQASDWIQRGKHESCYLQCDGFSLSLPQSLFLSLSLFLSPSSPSIADRSNSVYWNKIGKYEWPKMSKITREWNSSRPENSKTDLAPESPTGSHGIF